MLSRFSSSSWVNGNARFVIPLVLSLLLSTKLNAATTYYVDSQFGDDSDYTGTSLNWPNSGKGPGPFRTIQKAVNTAVAGDTIYVRYRAANDYAPFSINGTAKHSLQVVGYYQTPGDLDGAYAGQSTPANYNEIYHNPNGSGTRGNPTTLTKASPRIRSDANYTATGVAILNTHDIAIKNIWVSRCDVGITIDNSYNCTVDYAYVWDIGSPTIYADTSGHAFGIVMRNNPNGNSGGHNIRHCTLYNAGFNSLVISTGCNHNNVTYCSSISDDNSGGQWYSNVNYYFLINQASWNTLFECYAYKLKDPYRNNEFQEANGHAFLIQSLNSNESTENTIEYCYSFNCDDLVNLRGYWTHHNTIHDVESTIESGYETAPVSRGQLALYSAPHHNTFENISLHNSHTGILFMGRANNYAPATEAVDCQANAFLSIYMEVRASAVSLSSYPDEQFSQDLVGGTSMDVVNNAFVQMDVYAASTAVLKLVGREASSNTVLSCAFHNFDGRINGGYDSAYDSISHQKIENGLTVWQGMVPWDLSGSFSFTDCTFD